MADVSEVRVAGEVNRMIQAEVAALYARLEALRAQTRFPSFAPVNVPMVLVLGNHSSGKSTFINHMLGQRVQKTGRAPTDCTFTVLAAARATSGWTARRWCGTRSTASATCSGSSAASSCRRWSSRWWPVVRYWTTAGS